MCLAEAMKEARMASIETTKSRRLHVRLDFLAFSHEKNRRERIKRRRRRRRKKQPSPFHTFSSSASSASSSSTTTTPISSCFSSCSYFFPVPFFYSLNGIVAVRQEIFLITFQRVLSLLN